MADKSSSERNIIMIIDDNQVNLDVLFNFLKGRGFKVLVATDGETALEQMNYILPDLILLDIMMPGIDGFTTCRHLKSQAKTRDIPVIFMTALSETEHKVQGFQIGAVDYITKPFQKDEVLSRVQTHLMLRNLQRKLQSKNAELLQLNQNLERLVEEKTKLLLNQEKSAIIGRLTQGILHNLKNPLQVILTSGSLIQSKGEQLEDKFIVHHSLYIEKSVKKINQILNTLMIKSRRDQLEEVKLTDVNELVKNELELLAANLKLKNQVTQQVNFDLELPLVPLISSHVSQVFHNLIDNAMDAMWQKGEKKLTITTHQDFEKVYIDIQDTGCGISLENQTRLFDPFYSSKPAKGEENQAGEPTGTGLGLYICLELLKPFQGNIQVKSELGKGSIFTIVLPK